jgi:hypothetical protein
MTITRETFNCDACRNCPSFIKENFDNYPEKGCYKEGDSPCSIDNLSNDGAYEVEVGENCPLGREEGKKIWFVRHYPNFVKE